MRAGAAPLLLSVRRLERFFTVVVLPELRRFALRAFFAALLSISALAMESRESLRTLSPQMFSSKCFSSSSMRFCSFAMAESVGQYCASVCPSMLFVLYILPE